MSTSRRSSTVLADAPWGVDRINAGDAQLGDKISRRRSGPFAEVVDISAGERSSWLTLRDGAGRTDRIRPRATTMLWRARPPREET